MLARLGRAKDRTAADTPPNSGPDAPRGLSASWERGQLGLHARWGAVRQARVCSAGCHGRGPALCPNASTGKEGLAWVGSRRRRVAPHTQPSRTAQCHDMAVPHRRYGRTLNPKQGTALCMNACSFTAHISTTGSQVTLIALWARRGAQALRKRLQQTAQACVDTHGASEEPQLNHIIPSWRSTWPYRGLTQRLPNARSWAACDQKTSVRQTGEFLARGGRDPGVHGSGAIWCLTARHGAAPL